MLFVIFLESITSIDFQVHNPLANLKCKNIFHVETL